MLQHSSERLSADGNSLPDLTRSVNKEILNCSQELSELPLSSKGNPLTIIMLCISAFCQAVQDAVSGEKYEHFVQSNRAHYSHFKNDIDATIPDFRPFNGDVSGQSSLVPYSRTEPRGLDDIRKVIKR